MPTVAPEDDEYSMNDVSLGSPEDDESRRRQAVLRSRQAGGGIRPRRPQEPQEHPSTSTNMIRSEHTNGFGI